MNSRKALHIHVIEDHDDVGIQFLNIVDLI